MEFFKDNKLISIIGVLIIVVLLFSFSGSDQKVPTNLPLKSSGPIIAFGDSLVEGVGSRDPLGGFVSVLENRLGVEIINAGVSGNTTRDGINRLQDDILSKNPKLVIISLGGNDYLKRLPKEETISNLNQIVSRIHESGSAVILLGVKTGVLGDASKEVFEDVKKNQNPIYIENILGGIMFNDELMADAIHPNDAGYVLFAEKIIPILNQILN